MIKIGHIRMTRIEHISVNLILYTERVRLDGSTKSEEELWQDHCPSCA